MEFEEEDYRDKVPFSLHYIKDTYFQPVFTVGVDFDHIAV